MTPSAPSQDNAHRFRTPESRLLDLLRDGESYTLEEVLEEAPEFSWAQLFVAMDSLSRSGMVELRREGFMYWLRMTVPWPTRLTCCATTPPTRNWGRTTSGPRIPSDGPRHMSDI